MSKRSPFFHVGDKYKLIDELKTFFPAKINSYIEPFVGGGSAFMNIEAERYVLNDIDSNIIQLHRFLRTKATQKELCIKSLIDIAKEYGLSCSYVEDIIPTEFKTKYPKTYFAKYNSKAYYQMRCAQ